MYFSLHANPTRLLVNLVIMDLSEEISRLYCSNRSIKLGSLLHITNSTSVYLVYQREFRLDSLSQVHCYGVKLTPGSILSWKVIIKIVFYSCLRNGPLSLEYATGTKLF